MTKYVIYDTNTLIDLQHSFFWISQAHNFFSNNGYTILIPKSIEREFLEIQKKDMNNLRNLPCRQTDLSTLLNSYSLTKSSNFFSLEIEKIEKSLDYHNLRYQYKESLDLADKDIISLSREILDDQKTEKLVVLSGDQKLEEGCLEINRYYRDRLKVVNPFSQKWDKLFSFESSAPFIFSQEICEKIFSTNLGFYNYLSVHPNVLKCGDNKTQFNYVYGMYTASNKKKKSDIRVISHNDVGLYRMVLLNDIVSSKTKVLEVTKDGSLNFSFFNQDMTSNSISKFDKLKSSVIRKAKEKNLAPGLAKILENYLISSDAFILPKKHLKTLQYPPKQYI